MIKIRYFWPSLLLGFEWLLGNSRAGAEPLRVLSLSVASDEMLVDILEIRDQASKCSFAIVGLSKLAISDIYSNVAEAAKKYPSVSAESESIFQKKPQLVIATPFNSSELTAQLRSLKLRVEILSRFDRIADLRQNLLQVGDWLGCQTESLKLLNEMDAKLAPKDLPGARSPTVLGWNDSLVLAGKNTIFDDMITAAGARNALTKLNANGWSTISSETLVGLNPDFIVSSESNGGLDMVKSNLQKQPCCKHMQAVKAGNLIVIPERLLSSASHYVGDTVQNLRSILVQRTTTRTQSEPPK